MEIVEDPAAQKNIDIWLSGHYDPSVKDEIRQLLRDNPKEAIDAFYTKLAFGTAGMRGLMGVGSNRMNPYTVRAASQALANYLRKQSDSLSVFIGYDSRNNSNDFAIESAKVFAGNGIHVYLCRQLRPTPYVSFGCRFKHCSAAVMITASHNPARYNGYKVYWNDGGQVTAPHDENIITEFNAIQDPTQVKSVATVEHPLIEWVGEEVDHAYLQAISKLQLFPEQNRAKGDQLKIVFTSLHGTGITLMPEAMRLWGFNQLMLVEKQMTLDGNFPTVKVPNPEEPETLKMGIDLLNTVKGDLLIATDPDADRVAVAVRSEKGVEVLNGNQIACLCAEHICEGLSKGKGIPPRAAFIKTVVTTEMLRVITEAYHVACFDVLTGFKYIAEKIYQWEQDPKGYQFIFGCEESYGYLMGTQARDKDAILAGVLISEIALQAKLKGKTLVGTLNDLYKKYGYFWEQVKSIQFEESKEGKERMKVVLDGLYGHPPKRIADVNVIKIDDYKVGESTDLITGKKSLMHLPKADMLVFWLEDNTKLIVRPSGTEPKIKIYCGLVKKHFSTVSDAEKSSKKSGERYIAEMKMLFTDPKTHS